MPTTQSSSRHKQYKHLHFACKVICLILFSYLGDALRVFMGKLFGTACQIPGLVGWNSGEWAPCTTAPGTTDATGGALFSDLPANMLGCFIIGLFVAGTPNLGLAKHVNVAMLSSNSKFQNYRTIHFCIRTGFCGALTTFASWNTQMVIMLVNGNGTVLNSQWVSSLFGYGIGWMVALESFVLGRNVAIGLHRHFNPDLAKEADWLDDHAGLHMKVNCNLPDYERRYLYDVDLDSETKNEEESSSKPENQTLSATTSTNGVGGTSSPSRAVQEQITTTTPRVDSVLFQSYDSDNFHLLKQWKDTTHEYRRNRITPKSYIDELHEIEHVILELEQELDEDLLQLAQEHEWDVQALQEWKRLQTKQEEETNGTTTSNNRQGCCHPDRIVMEFGGYVVAFCIWTGGILWFMLEYSNSDATIAVNYRTSALSILLSPLGTMSRWFLSRYNGTWSRYPWFPCGTFMANMMACILSALLAGLSLKLEDNTTAYVWVRAIKLGYAGSLSTVSIFVMETEWLLRELPRKAWGYYYSVGSLVTACILGICSYVWATV